MGEPCRSAIPKFSIINYNNNGILCYLDMLITFQHNYMYLINTVMC